MALPTGSPTTTTTTTATDRTFQSSDSNRRNTYTYTNNPTGPSNNQAIPTQSEISHFLHFEDNDCFFAPTGPYPYQRHERAGSGSSTTTTTTTGR
ncbi:hypothetical protein VTN96DRAFT_7216 [Rasamsonia emersonii]|uniref:Uncharacterized protein n=1 Tax=Rasamsonia emersonii (strain ATCC 16479 / CBS 393.64 / IMI 116815) TaxID=1408163 RepID=A0A0F4Z539_RASE3|nr:hypothetical protein T310_0363 [Rasamsonia emersonii CBS 393.64]KKA25634.1 hypothetical protein T310_0363 [Rasamsonia emersonii CBS 393.64]